MRESELLSRMLELCLKRRETYKTSVIERFPPLATIKERTTLGMFSWTLQESKQRWIHELNCIDLLGYPQTRSEITRDYLSIVNPRKLRAKGWQAENFTQHRAPPTFAKVGKWGDCTYVDLKSAYWSILGVTGWDVDYYPGKWILPGRVPYDFPLINDKIARICLVSAGLNAPTRIWTGSQVIVIRTQNSHLNLGVWSICQDLLHTLANIAERLGAVHIHTDGYIVPTSNAEYLINRIREFGLVARPKATGSTWIHAVGSYQCGEHHTKNIVKALKPITSTLYATDEKFIEKRFRYLAEWRIRTGNVHGSSKSGVE